jgi:hypothetical protein
MTFNLRQAPVGIQAKQKIEKHLTVLSNAFHLIIELLIG